MDSADMPNPESLLLYRVAAVKDLDRIIATRMKRMTFEQTAACESACFEKRVLCKGRYGIIGAGGDKTAVRTQNGGYQHLITAYEKYEEPVDPAVGLRYRTK
jgi:hypothetical protein